MFVGIPKKVFLVTGFSVLTVVFSQGVSAQSEIASIQSDIDAWKSVNGYCRGVSDPEFYVPACDLRDQLTKRLQAIGYCRDDGGWRSCQSPTSQIAENDGEADLEGDLTKAEAMLTICKYGQTEGQGASDAQSLCVGRLAGAARIMQYNCISLQGGAQPTPVLTMGDFPDGATLVSVFLDFMASNPQEAQTEWSFVAFSAFSQAFPCE